MIYPTSVKAEVHFTQLQSIILSLDSTQSKFEVTFQLHELGPVFEASCPFQNVDHGSLDGKTIVIAGSIRKCTNLGKSSGGATGPQLPPSSPQLFHRACSWIKSKHANVSLISTRSFFMHYCSSVLLFPLFKVNS